MCRWVVNAHRAIPSIYQQLQANSCVDSAQRLAQALIHSPTVDLCDGLANRRSVDKRTAGCAGNTADGA